MGSRYDIGGINEMRLTTAFRNVAVTGGILTIAGLAANQVESQSLIFGDGFELGSSAG